MFQPTDLLLALIEADEAIHLARGSDPAKCDGLVFLRDYVERVDPAMTIEEGLVRFEAYAKRAKNKQAFQAAQWCDGLLLNQRDNLYPDLVARLEAIINATPEYIAWRQQAMY